jgi:DNA-binding NarL/FixJ family response regulator
MHDSGTREYMIQPGNGRAKTLREASEETPIRVFLIVENRLLREALSRLFRKSADLQVVGESGDRKLSHQELLDAKVDVLAVDFFDSQWQASLFVQVAPDFCKPKTVLVGMDGDSNAFLEAVRAGVNGYLLKDTSAAGVVASIRAVCKGEAVCPPKLCSILFQRVHKSADLEQVQRLPPRPDLTLRQLQLVSLVAKGMTNKEIAVNLNLSEFTVKNHIHRILKKAEVGTRRNAVDVVRAWSGGRSGSYELDLAGLSVTQTTLQCDLEHR